MIDLILACICWYRGWPFLKAILPLCATVGLGIIAGVICGVASIEPPVIPLVIFNIVVWVVQVWMIFNPPEKIEAEPKV